MKIWKIAIDFLRKAGQKVYKNIANIISILRIVCSPIVAIMMVCAFYQFVAYGKVTWPGKYSDFVFYLFIGCQISDAVDGLLARILRIASRWGAYLDRIGDKVLIVPIFILMLLYYLVLAFQLKSFLAFPITGFLLGSIYLEKLLMQYGIMGFKTKAPVNSNIYGKTKMVLQCIQSSYWMMGFLMPDTVLDFYWIKVSADPLAIHNLAFTLILLGAILGFTMGSIAGYKSLPAYKKLLGENNGE